MLTVGNFKGTSDFFPTSVKNAVGQPPICDVIRVAGQSQVIRYIEFELIKMTQLISVGNNLNNAQVEFIATQLVEMFPNESLADFKICFQRGCIGQYGEIFRMDGIVLRKWMEKYLDEKYSLIDETWKKEKSGEYHEPTQQSEVGPGRKMFDDWANSLRMGTKVPAMDQRDIEKYGKEKPVKKAGTAHPNITEEGLEASKLQDLRVEYGRLHTDKLTGKPLPGAPTFNEFIRDL